MKGSETQGDDAGGTSIKLLVTRNHRRTQYQKVFDARKRRLRGLWQRNGTFYGQLTIINPATGAKAVRRVRLEDKDGQPVATVPQAVAVLNKMKGQREDEALKIAPKRTPTLAEQAATYFQRLESFSSATGNAKAPNTIKREKADVRALTPLLGPLRLREILPPVVANYVAARIKAGVSARTANLEVNTLRNILKSAAEDRLIAAVPKFQKLEEIKTVRRCLTTAEIERVANAAKAAPMTGQMVQTSFCSWPTRADAGRKL